MNTNSAAFLKDWLDAKKAREDLSAQYIVVGALTPGERIPRPPKVLDEESINLLDAAQKREDDAHRRYLSAFNS